MPTTAAETYAEDNEAVLLALIELGFTTHTDAEQAFNLLRSRFDQLAATPPVERVFLALNEHHNAS